MLKSVHREVFEIYEIEQAKVYSKEARKKRLNKMQKIRHTINRALEKSFKGRNWEELTEWERKRFLYIVIKENILKRYVDPSKHDKIRRKIDQYVNSTMLEAQIKLEKYNKRVSVANESFYVAEDDEETKKKAYIEFRSALENYNYRVAIPSYNEWVSSNEAAIKTNNCPLTIYDYVRSYFDNEIEEGYYAAQQDIDHIILQTLLKELKIDIDIPKITKCLAVRRAMQERGFDDRDEFFLEIDESLFPKSSSSEDTDKQEQEYKPRTLTLEEQKRIIDENIEYQICETALEKLDFIKKDR